MTDTFSGMRPPHVAEHSAVNPKRVLFYYFGFAIMYAISIFFLNEYVYSRRCEET